MEELMSLQFKHLRDFSNNGGATFAVNLEDISLEKVDVNDVVQIKLGISKCSSKDNFSRKTGRDLAISRLKTSSLRVTCIQKFITEAGSISHKIVLEGDGVYLVFSRFSNSSNFRLRSASAIS